MTDTALNYQPFPPLTWRDGGWEAAVVLGVWSGFSIRSSPEGPRYRASDGTFNLVIMTEPTAETPHRAPAPAQTSAYNFLLQNQQPIQNAILEALIPYYSEQRPDYKEFLGRDFKLLMPKISNLAVFRELISPCILYLHNAGKGGMAYAGYLFSASWEVEHGLGFVLNGDRVIAVGEAETAFNFAAV